MAQAISPSGHRTVGRPAFDHLGNILQLGDVLPVVIRQVGAHQALPILAVAADTVRLVRDLTYRQPLGLVEVVEQGRFVRLEIPNFRESPLEDGGRLLIEVVINRSSGRGSKVKVEPVACRKNTGGPEQPFPPTRGRVVILRDSVVDMFTSQALDFVLEGNLASLLSGLMMDCK